MRKKLARLLTYAMGVSMMCVAPVYAVGRGGGQRVLESSSSIRTVSVQGYTFDISTTLYYSKTQFKTGVRIVESEQRLMPADALEARAYLFDGEKNLLSDSGLGLQNGVSHYVNQETRPCVSTDTEFYAYGAATVTFSASGVSTNIRTPILHYRNGAVQEYQTALLPAEENDLPVNRDGLTYGDLVDHRLDELDLIAAVGVGGVRGYVLQEDLVPELYTLEAKQDRVIALRENNRIPLYDLKGNVIGQYALGVGHGEKTEAAPASVSYPQNGSGETYGTIFDHSRMGRNPSLIAVVGDSGVAGYVRYREFRRTRQNGATLQVFDLQGCVVDRFTFRTAQ